MFANCFIGDQKSTEGAPLRPPGARAERAQLPARRGARAAHRGAKERRIGSEGAFGDRPRKAPEGSSAVVVSARDSRGVPRYGAADPVASRRKRPIDSFPIGGVTGLV